MAEFSSYEELKYWIEEYQEKNFVQLWRRDARTIEHMRKSCPRRLKTYNKDLIYYGLTFSCVRGGRSFKPLGKGLRKVSTYKNNCPMYIKVRLTDDCQRLKIVHIQDVHNHAKDKELFKTLPGQKTKLESPGKDILKICGLKDYFEVTDEEKKRALCNICASSFAFKYSVSNLLKHLQFKHNIVIKDGECDIVTEYLDDSSDEISGNSLSMGQESTFESNMWAYFERENPWLKIARCKLCYQKLSYKDSLANLRRHLMKKHCNNVDLDDKDILILFTGDEILELEMPLNKDSIHIGDIKNEKIEEIEMENNTIDILELSNDESSKCNESEEESSNIWPNEHSQDSLDHFGNYIVSLLRQLPADISNELQSQFVAQIMRAKTANESYASNVITDNTDVITDVITDNTDVITDNTDVITTLHCTQNTVGDDEELIVPNK